MRFSRIAAGLTAVLPFIPLPLSAASAVYPIEETSIAGLEAAYLSGQTTAHAVTQAYLDRIEAYDKRGPLAGDMPLAMPKARRRLNPHRSRQRYKRKMALRKLALRCA